MLIQFAVENFKSFRDKAVLSMVASDTAPHPEHMVVTTASRLKLLKCAALYGANASGKTNLIEAIAFARDLVVEGTKPGQRIALKPFRPAKSANGQSRFEFDIYRAGQHFSYGFLISTEHIIGEWLVAVEGEQERLLFERSYEERQPERPAIEFGDALSRDPERRQFLQFVAEGTRPNQLFLTEAASRNVVEFAPVASWFFESVIADIVRYRDPSALLGAVEQLSTDGRFRELVEQLLAKADTGIVRLEVNDAREGIPVQMVHDGPNGTSVTFELYEESAGTLRLIELAPMLHACRTTTRGPLYIVDELDRSMHPLLSSLFLSAFMAALECPGQLIFSTHDTNLLDAKLLSRDSIWFVEKDATANSVLYSLAEFKPEQLDEIGDQVEKGYLIGRFGAIPFLGDPRRLPGMPRQGRPR